MGIPVPLFWLRTFYVEFRWSPDEVHLESRYIKYKFKYIPGGLQMVTGVQLEST